MRFPTWFTNYLESFRPVRELTLHDRQRSHRFRRPDGRIACYVSWRQA